MTYGKTVYTEDEVVGLMNKFGYLSRIVGHIVETAPEEFGLGRELGENDRYLRHLEDLPEALGNLEKVVSPQLMQRMDGYIISQARSYIDKGINRKSSSLSSSKE